MSTTSNLYSQGGGGTHYEFEVDTAFMIQFLISGTVPGIDNGKIDSIRFQSGSLGYKTDDLLLECSDFNGDNYKILCQVKHTLTISEKNEEFTTVIQRAWDDFSNANLFNKGRDKIYIVKAYLSSDEKKHLKVICNWAKVKRSSDDFFNEANQIKGKKKYLQIFKSVLSTETKTLTDEELFQFFMSFDILEYDFGEVASTAKVSFLTIIDHAKAPDCDLQPGILWNELFAFVSSADNKGGSFDRKNIPSSLCAYFKSNYYAGLQKKLINISRQGFEIIDNIKDCIGSVTLTRLEYLEMATSALASERLVIITGEPGSGKSVIAKHLLNAIDKSRSGYTLVFKADELNMSNLRDYFLKFDIQLSVSEIFSFFPLHAEHYVYIDSLEKLTEVEGEGFKQLLNISKQFPHIKIIATCREAELPLIRIKYLSENLTEPIKVKLLNTEELGHIKKQLPSIQPILENTRLHSLLSVPKYLDFAYRAVELSGNNFGDSDEPEFIQQLWDIIIENKTSQNIAGALKRNKAFIEIAVARAKKMMPFVILDNPDYDAISDLIKEGVIIKSPSIDAYAPSHDILEDWALIRHVDQAFFHQKDPKPFYELLGVEPAMRRAYRLWVLQALKIQQAEKLEFFIAVITKSEVERFWQDESIVALLYSPYLPKFLMAYKELLLKNDWSLLVRIIHIMKTACRGYGTIKDTEEKRFIPVGESWQHIIHFIFTHFQELPDKLYYLVFYTIRDWHFILLSNDNPQEVAGEAGTIIKHLIELNILKEDRYYNQRNDVEVGVQIMLACTGGFPDIISDLLSKATTSYGNDDLDRATQNYYEKVTEVALGNFYSVQLAKYLPTQLLALLKKEWYYVEPHISPDYEPWYRMSRSSSMDSNPSFGLASEYKRDYFPASAFQTPVYWLLKNHPDSTLDFVIELMNHSSETFINSEYASSVERTTAEIILPGETITQYGSIALWCMYRGTGIATPYLLKSVLMALEKFLLELAAEGIEKREQLQGHIEKLYRKSKTVALTAVISSVVQAYPLQTGKWVTPLYSDRKLIAWDLNRYQHDLSPLAPSLMDDKRFQKERITSNNLPHRLKHTAGLKSFIIDYCFNIREYNAEIFKQLDNLKKKAPRKDWVWKRMLFDMDIRNWKVTKTERKENSVQYQVEPVHTGKLKEKAAEMQNEAEEFLAIKGQSSWLLGVKKRKEPPDFIKWKEVLDHYQSLDEFNIYHHSPGLVSQIGVEFFWEKLNDEDKKWCYDTTCSITLRLTQKNIEQDFLTANISVFDDDAIAETLPLFIKKDSIDQDDFLFFLVQVICSNISYNTPWFKKLLATFSNFAWQIDPENALRIWLCLIHFAELEFRNPSHKPPFNRTEEFEAEVESLFRCGLKAQLPLDVSSLSLMSSSQWVLLKAVRLVPNDNCPTECIAFLKQMVKLFINDKLTPAEPGQRRRRFTDLEEGQFDYHLLNELQDKIPKVILWSAESTGKEFFQWIMEEYYSPVIWHAEDLESKGDILKFFRHTIKYIILNADWNLPEDNEQKTQETIRCFKTIWQCYVSVIVDKDVIISGDLLFLDIDWREDARHWKPLDEMKQFFIGLITLFGHLYPESVINLLGHVGDKTLLPEGLTLLWKKLKLQIDRPKLISIPKIVQLIYRVYNHYQDKLINDHAFRQDYLDMLDELINEGSSDAYWIREYLISFRKPIANSVPSALS